MTGLASQCMLVHRGFLPFAPGAFAHKNHKRQFRCAKRNDSPVQVELSWMLALICLLAVQACTEKAVGGDIKQCCRTVLDTKPGVVKRRLRQHYVRAVGGDKQEPNGQVYTGLHCNRTCSLVHHPPSLEPAVCLSQPV